MTPAIEKPFSPGTRLTRTDAAHFDVSLTRHVLDASKFRPRPHEDEIVFKRWRLGFFIFYGATALLLVGVGVAADRPATLASAAAPTKPAIVSADATRRPH
jgi:hypothetical protein